MLMLKFQCFGQLMWRTNSWKDPDAGKDWRQEEKGTAEDVMVGWNHWLNGHESEQAPRVGDGQGGLACYSPWGCKELDTTEWLNWNWLNHWTTRDFPSSHCSKSRDFSLKKSQIGTSLVVQWVRLQAPNIGGLGSIPGQGTRTYIHTVSKSLQRRSWESHN